ncbi:pantetheine-phosphate adenylyltransferase [Zophobihabitans entericus]|uniref:Phosphopantetheine adenylyltransferase n=1 Tax=Zophobihabitans entericus TaxID=1635327 RepID=A0A6G9IET2_9GAMM|nr:pantetheine-phosphate adenylyltransferase [Zophobihabitans entericus]
MPTAIFPGTFDPITNGHVELITRAAPLFQRLIIGVAASPSKKTLFSLEERVLLAAEAIKHLPNVEAIGYTNLMAEFASQQGATMLVRGVRTTYDFEYERQLAEMNRHLKADLDTIFLMPSPETGFISSSIVREVALHKGEVSGLVPKHVEQQLLKKVNSK